MARERFVITQSTVIPSYLGTHGLTFPALKFMDANQSPYDSNNVINIIDEQIILPASGLVELDYIPAGNPLSATALVIKDASGNTLTKAVGTAPAASRVRVYPQRGYIDFDATAWAVGAVFTASYAAAFSSVSGTALTMFAAELNAITSILLAGNFTGNQYGGYIDAKASSDIPSDSVVSLHWNNGAAGSYLGYVIYLHDFNSFVKRPPLGYVPSGGPANSIIRVVHNGMVETLAIGTAHYPHTFGTTLYAGVAPGSYKWDEDTDVSYKLEGTNYPASPIGTFISGNSALINIMPKALIG